jgi:hypothetical protein
MPRYRIEGVLVATGRKVGPTEVESASEFSLCQRLEEKGIHPTRIEPLKSPPPNIAVRSSPAPLVPPPPPRRLNRQQDSSRWTLKVIAVSMVSLVISVLALYATAFAVVIHATTTGHLWLMLFYAVAVVVAAVGIWVYFLPSYISHKRSHPNRTAILVLNLVGGWTVVGWIVAIVWACLNVERQRIG